MAGPNTEDTGVFEARAAPPLRWLILCTANIRPNNYGGPPFRTTAVTVFQKTATLTRGPFTNRLPKPEIGPRPQASQQRYCHLAASRPPRAARPGCGRRSRTNCRIPPTPGSPTAVHGPFERGRPWEAPTERWRRPCLGTPGGTWVSVNSTSEQLASRAGSLGGWGNGYEACV